MARRGCTSRSCHSHAGRVPGRRVRAGCRPRCRTRRRTSEMNSSPSVHCRHLAVELFERLGRVAELTQEDAQQVLGLEGGDRRLDAVTGHVADDGGDPGRGRRGTRRRSHRPSCPYPAGRPGRSRSPSKSGRSLGGQALGPALGGQVVLGEHLLGPTLELGPVLGDAGLGARSPGRRQSETTAGTSTAPRRRRPATAGRPAATATRATATTPYRAGGVQILAVVGLGQRRPVGVGVRVDQTRARAVAGCRADRPHTHRGRRRTGDRRDQRRARRRIQ